MKQLTAGDRSSTICLLGIHWPFTRFPLWIKTDGSHLTQTCFCPPDGFIAKIWAHLWKTFKILNPKDVNVHSALQKIKSQMYYFAVTQFFFFRIRGALKVFLSEIMFLFFIYFSGLLKICSHKHKKSCLIHHCAHLSTFILCSKAVNSGCFQLLSITER